MKTGDIWLLPFFLVCASSFTLDSYAALGDSYATGGGAGDAIVWPPSEAKCGHFTGSYPKQIANANPGTIFRNLACGGSSTTSVLVAQVPWIEDSQVVTLTIGGNEVDFFKVVNDCVYQWVLPADCNATIARSRAAIESEYFRQNLEKLIKAIVEEMVPGGRLLVTSYAKFFNDMTTQCDDISFSRRNPANKLTRGRRAELNDLLRLLNYVIKTTAVDNGAEYVDIDVVFVGHRFCEEGVMEPDTQRNETWFLTLDHSRNANEDALDDYHNTNTQSVLTHAGIPDLSVFHPTILGQKAIADAIMKQLQSTPAFRLSWPLKSTTADSRYSDMPLYRRSNSS